MFKRALCGWLVGLGVIVSVPALAQVDPLTRLHHPLGGTFSEGATSDYLGAAVAIDGDTAVVGMSSDSFGSVVRAGSVFVYQRQAGNWVQTAKLVAPTPIANAFFGSAVDLDGDTLVVGAPDSEFGGFAAGLAYVFVRTNGNWVNQATFAPATPSANARFGYSVALDGDLAVIGAPYRTLDGSVNRGEAEVFTRSSGSWTRREALTAGSGSSEFGSAVDVSGSLIAIGASHDSSGGATNNGRVFVYRKPTPESIVQEAVLVGSSSSDFDFFGRAVALLGDTLMVGAPELDRPLANDEGGVFVFERNSDSTWSERAILRPQAISANLKLGVSLSLQPGMVLVGAKGPTVGSGINIRSGSALIYTGSSDSWQFRANLLPPESLGTFREVGAAVALGNGFCLVGAPATQVGSNPAQGYVLAFEGGPDNWLRDIDLFLAAGQQYAVFGSAVAMSPDGNLLAVGAPYSVNNTSPSVTAGLVMVYRRSPQSGWQLEATLSSPTPEGSGEFGRAVSISNDEVAVGAPGESGSGLFREGRAYIYRYNGAAWMHNTTLNPPFPTTDGLFGQSVSLDFNQLAVGAPGNVSGFGGVVHIYRTNGGVWQGHASITQAAAGVNGAFGYVVSLDGSRLAIGAPGQRVSGQSNWGSVYLYTQVSGDWNIATFASFTAPGAGNGSVPKFGYAVALRHPYMVVGAPQFNNRGQVFGYFDSGLGMSEVFQYAPLGGGGDGAGFGSSVAIAGSDLVVGAPFFDTDSGLQQVGSVFVLERDPSAQWRERLQIQGRHDAFGAQLGTAVAGSNYDYAYGAPQESGPAPRGNPAEGSVYIQDKDLNFKDSFE